MAASERWYFDLEQIYSTPSIKCGYDHDKELSCRQQAANFIQDMGQRLQVNQLCINTAIVYMHRFYMFHSFQRFHRTSLASAALFLAAKVEEQPRKLEHVIRFAQICLHRDQMLDVTSQAYLEQVQDLIMNENILLQTLGFDVAIDHPHTHIVRCCQLVRASKDLAQTSYFMASYSLHLTTMCLQYKPTVVACFCIHLACKWSNWEIPESSEGKQWFWYVDKSVTSELLENLTAEFLNLFEKCPSRLKKKIMALSSYSSIPPLPGNPQGQIMHINQVDMEKKKEARMAVDSHNPMNSLPLPIGPLGAAVDSIHSSHPFIHQNPMVVRHSSSSDGLMKKHHYEVAAAAAAAQRNPQPPPPLPPPPPPAEQPYKKPHHPPHHQREGQLGGKLPSSCMFDGGVPHKSYPQHGPVPAPHLLPAPPLHPATSRTTNHVPTTSRTPAVRTHVRNGEAHFTEKKFYPDLNKPVDSKPHQVVGPRIKAKTPPPQIMSLPIQPEQVLIPPIKGERSIFSPDEKPSSPPLIQTRIPEKPKSSPVAAPVVIKKESPQLEPPCLPVAVPLESRPPQPPIQPSVTTGEPAGRERVASSQPLAAPDTPSKSSHVKKKKKKHKEHKEKHKDKHKHKHRLKEPEPIVITIPKEKITISQPESLKIKIAKDKISAPTTATTGLKLKISKDKLKKRERGSDAEDDVQQASKQHRPNGTSALQVTTPSSFSSVLGKSILSPIRTPHFSDHCNSSPLTSPTHIPKYSPTQSGHCKTPVIKPSASPPSPLHKSPIAPEVSHSELSVDSAVSPLQCKPFLSPIAATPRHTSTTKCFKSPPLVETPSSRFSDFSHMSPIRSKPFLSPIAATPRHIPKTKTFKSPPAVRSDLPLHGGDQELPHMSPIRSKPFLSPLAPTPRHSHKIKTFKSPPTSHVYVPIAGSRSRSVDMPHMSLGHGKTLLSPIAPTPRYPSPKRNNSPPVMHRYIPIAEVDQSYASSSSSAGSAHSSPEQFGNIDKPPSPVLCPQEVTLKRPSPYSPPLGTSFEPDYHEDKKLLSPIQTPAHYPKIKTPPYEPPKLNSPIGSFEESHSPLDETIQSPDATHDADNLHYSGASLDVNDDDHPYDSDEGSSSKHFPEKLPCDSDKDSMCDDNSNTCLGDFNSKPDSSVVDSSCDTEKDPFGNIKSEIPDSKNERDAHEDCDYQVYCPYDSSIDPSSPLGSMENGNKCLLSPIMTPGRSPIHTEKKVTSPVVVPRYSPTDPHSLGCTTAKEHGRTSPGGYRSRKGPQTPPSPVTHYDPITPARPDPNEIIFKDSNHNHTDRPPHVLKKPYDRRLDDNKPYPRKQPLLPDFKIPRTTLRPRRHPGQEPWAGRPRGRGGHFYPRGRGRGVHHYRHPSRQYYPRAQHYEPEHQVQHFDPSLVLQGNAYDAAVVKHAYETMGVMPDYFMHHYHQQLYVPSFPPPPPLPDEPPPQPPPPPPPPI